MLHEYNIMTYVGSP